MKFYRWETSRKFFDRKYAYLSVNKTNSCENYDGQMEQYLEFKCPHCGFEANRLFYTDKNIAVFNKDSVGDISMGVHSYGHISFSQKVLDMIDKYHLIGISDVKQYNFMETSRHKPITSLQGAYYSATVQFETAIIRHVDSLKHGLGETFLIEKSEKLGCSKCQGGITVLGLSKDAQVYLEGLNEIKSDIFSIIYSPSEIFFSERFIEACRVENITNILNKIVEVYDISELKQ